MKNPLTNGRILKVDCSIKEYLAAPFISRSDLCEISTCPERWHNGYRGDPDKRTPSTDFGSLLDCLLLQPHKIAEYYKHPPKTYIDSKKKETDWTWKSSTCRAWRDEQREAGFEVCSDEDLTEAKQALFALNRNEQTVRLIEKSQHQVFAVADYHDKATDMVVTVKVLTDILPAANDPEFGTIVEDLKTAQSAHPKAWKRAVEKSDYHVQGAMNLDVHNAIEGNKRETFRHLIVENFSPWQSARRYLSPAFEDLGREKYVEALKTFCQCTKRGIWPGYADSHAVVVAGYECVEPEAYMVTSTGPRPDPSWAAGA